MIDIKQDRRASWFDPQGSRMLAARLSDRLVRRVQGESGVFVTLTYDRKPWRDSKSLYRAASDDRHVRRFIEELAALLGQSLTGRWVCKMEFQDRGYVHWHLLILGVKHIPHDVLNECWGWGHVWIKRMTTTRVRYLAKYVAKPGSIPPWLLLEPVRSVKFIRVSTGFWSPLNEPKRQRSEPQEVEGNYRGCAFIPVGLAMQRAEHRTQVVDPDRGTRCRVDLSPSEFVTRVVAEGCRPVAGGRQGWLRIDLMTFEDARRLGRVARPKGGPPPLHLIDTGEPPFWVMHALEEEAA